MQQSAGAQGMWNASSPQWGGTGSGLRAPLQRGDGRVAGPRRLPGRLAGRQALNHLCQLPQRSLIGGQVDDVGRDEAVGEVLPLLAEVELAAAHNQVAALRRCPAEDMPWAEQWNGLEWIIFWLSDCGSRPPACPWRPCRGCHSLCWRVAGVACTGDAHAGT